LGTDQYKPYKLPGVMGFLTAMKAAGKIRHLGFSFHDTPDVMDFIIQDYPWDFVQIQCNYLDWTFQDAKRLYETIEKRGIPCIVMEPVRGGTLATLCDESQAIFKAANPQASIASWAIRYVASKSNVLVVLSGMSNEEQTLDNLKTMTNFKPISSNEQLVIDKALDAFIKSRTIPCTACRYCMPCPQGVDIPLMFKIYNNYAISKHKWAFAEEYEETEESKRAVHCIACGECMPHCPQKIEIPTKMTEIAELYASIKQETAKK
jgi:predicted aldo/keto reductase-like oxidoreductase